jgi:hypothetical protein
MTKNYSLFSHYFCFLVVNGPNVRNQPSQIQLKYTMKAKKQEAVYVF